MAITLILGASTNPERYAYKALKKLQFNGHLVKATSVKKGAVNGVEFLPPFTILSGIDTVTLYINSLHQQAYYDYILKLKPRRVIFNPGTENEEFEAILQENNIEPIEACTLVMLSIGTY